MTEEQIQERLLQAALTEVVVIPPNLETKLEASLQLSPKGGGRSMRTRNLRWVGYAAAVVAAAITIPIVVNRLHPGFTPTDDISSNTEDTKAAFHTEHVPCLETNAIIEHQHEASHSDSSIDRNLPNKYQAIYNQINDSDMQITKRLISCSILAVSAIAQAQTPTIELPKQEQEHDTQHHVVQVSHCWGQGDERMPLPTLQLGLQLGKAQDHRCRHTKDMNYGISLNYNILQYSTYDISRPYYFGGGITLGLQMQLQPEKGCYCTSKCVDQLAWNGDLSIAFPTTFTVRIGNEDTHQLSLGIEPEFFTGPDGIIKESGTMGWGFAFRTITQYRYKNLFFSLRPSIRISSHNDYKPYSTYVRFGFGMNFN